MPLLLIWCYNTRVCSYTTLYSFLNQKVTRICNAVQGALWHDERRNLTPNICFQTLFLSVAGSACLPSQKSIDQKKNTHEKQTRVIRAHNSILISEVYHKEVYSSLDGFY